MRRLAVLLVLVSSVAFARGYGGPGYHHVRSYTKKNGTYVHQHYAKNPSRRK